MSGSQPQKVRPRPIGGSAFGSLRFFLQCALGETTCSPTAPQPLLTHLHAQEWVSDTPPTPQGNPDTDTESSLSPISPLRGAGVWMAAAAAPAAAMRRRITPELLTGAEAEEALRIRIPLDEESDAQGAHHFYKIDARAEQVERERLAYEEDQALERELLLAQQRQFESSMVPIEDSKDKCVYTVYAEIQG